MSTSISHLQSLEIILNYLLKIMRLSLSIIISYSLLIICIITPVSTQVEQFKISKLNLIWTKAQHSVGPGKLKDLKTDLTKHEFDQLTLKKMKALNQDKDGLFEAAVRKKLLSIMAKYSLEQYYDDIHPPVENEHELKKDNLNKAKLASSNPIGELKSTFRDKKLDKLWKKAEQSGFTQEQLMILHEEFEHQQEKLDEHYDTMNLIEQELEKRNKEGERWENSIESNIDKEPKRKSTQNEVKESQSEKKARLDSNIHQVLKEKYSDIKKNIDKLHKKIISGKVDDNEAPFEEGPVNDLWSTAIQANFTASELESLKEELEHYQTRIKKLKHFQYELERNKIGSKDSSGDDDDEAKHIRRRVKELAHKVDKTHKSLEQKIVTRREEL